MTEIEITAAQEREAVNYCCDKLLDPNQYGGAWFDGDSEKLEDWMGDIFFDAVYHFMDGLGIKVVMIDEEEP